MSEVMNVLGDECRGDECRTIQNIISSSFADSPENKGVLAPVECNGGEVGGCESIHTGRTTNLDKRKILSCKHIITVQTKENDRDA